MSNYTIKDMAHYRKAYAESVENPEKFWTEIAEQNFVWREKWAKTFEHNFEQGHAKWFLDAKLNITENCIDRHLASRGDKTAIIWEPNDPKTPGLHISYRDLHQRVCKFANVLKDNGIKKGDRVCIYLPMIPELAVSLLACARIGAIHSVVFAGFSSSALERRIVDCGCKMVITSDGSHRGAKSIDLKPIVDEALKSCPGVETVLVFKHTNSKIEMIEGRDIWLRPLLDKADSDCPLEVMDAEDPLFILYTSGSTGKPKGMLHTTAGYMVYSAYTFRNIFRPEETDVYWCTADIGWITGHSYLVYGPLINGATTVLFEGAPSYPDFDRYWEIIAKHKVNQFYTAPTAIRSLEKEGVAHPQRHDLSSLKVLGSVGEPINEEAWHWYNDNIGKKRCPIADTWWQTETGGHMIAPIPYVTPTKPMFATLPLPGIQVALMDEAKKIISGSDEPGSLCITFPWPSMARTIWGDHERFKDIYFKAYPGSYFSGDGAYRDEDGYYRIIGRVDDVIIVSGHNLGTAPIEDAINEHEAAIESAVIGFPHDIKGNALYGFVILNQAVENENALRKEINDLISSRIGPIAKLDKIQFVTGLPRTRSGKIIRRILRKIAVNDIENLGDVSTLLNPEVIPEIIKNVLRD